MAGLSAAIYLGRARRDTLLLDAGKSMAQGEPDVQNYLGFPDGISGSDLLARARQQARRYGIRCKREHVIRGWTRKGSFSLRGETGRYVCKRLLLATGILHIPPNIAGANTCLGHSMFFCKDCDGFRVQGKPIGVYGWRNEAVDYALGMLCYSSCVVILTDGHAPQWDKRRAGWIREYQIPVYLQPVIGTRRTRRRIRALRLNDRSLIEVAALFTTRGDIYFNKLAAQLGARINQNGEIAVDLNMRTTVPGLYAAGCVTPANCQMIIAAGQGAVSAQAINRDLFEESLKTHSLRRLRVRQLRYEKTRPRRKKAKTA
ncbi:MAG: thioredoxin reductase [Verrucomicrobiota bacterium]